jgi:RHS repeat-associated protein
LHWDWLGDPFADPFGQESERSGSRPRGSSAVRAPATPERTATGADGAPGGSAAPQVPATPPSTPDGVTAGGADPLTQAAEAFALGLAGSAGATVAPPQPVPPPQPPPPPGDEPSGRLDQHSLRRNFARLPLHFEPNQGQADRGVDFLSRGRGYGVYLAPTQAALVLSKRLDATPARTRAVVRVQFLGADPAARGRGLEQLPGRSNYFQGTDASKWVTGLPQYARVRYEDIYPGIDLDYYGTNQRQLEYDFVVAPGADPGHIQLGVSGIGNLRLNEAGDLVLPGPGGDVLQKAPVAYQLVNGQRQVVSARYVMQPGQRVGFRLGNYDADRPLYIDPALLYSSYFGGEGDDSGAAITVDAAGNAYLVGTTSSGDLPVVSGGAQGTLSGPSDAFALKLNPAGTEMVYATYLGGSGDEEGVGIALDASGNAYLAGTSNSANFPTTAGAFQTSRKGDNDLFLTKLSPAGNTLAYSTLLGGTNVSTNEQAGGIAVDGGGHAYLTGSSAASDFPVTAGAWRTSHAGNGDAVVAKLKPDGSGLLYGTYLGGGAADAGHGLAVTATGAVVVVGETASSNFPTVNPLQGSRQGATDAFVTQLTPTGAGAAYSTYLGGSGGETAAAVALDVLGNSYLTGSTDSSNFPTLNAYQATKTGWWDAFVTKVGATGQLVYSTYLRGSEVNAYQTNGLAIAVDYTGSAHVAGRTDSPAFPVLNPVQATLNAGEGSSSNFDGFVTQFTPSGSALLFSSYLGGFHGDEIRGLAVDPLRRVFLTGVTSSQDFPTQAPLLGWRGGATDAFVAQLDPLPSPPWEGGASVTADQTLVFGGTALPGSTVRLTREGVGVIGTVTANGSGQWSVDYTGTVLPEGTHAFTATQTWNGQTSRPSSSVVTVDLAAPVITLDAPTTTFDRSPLVRITVDEFVGLAEEPTATLDVDLNNDGDFTDANETAYTSAALVHGYAEVEIRKPASYLNLGTVKVRARVTDRAGHQGTSAVHTVNIVTQPNPWQVTAEVRHNVPGASLTLANTGAVRVGHFLDLDRSPGAGQVPGQAPVSDPTAHPYGCDTLLSDGSDSCATPPDWRHIQLVYQSDTVSPQFIVQASIPTANTQGLPAAIRAQLGSPGGTWMTVDDRSPGDLLLAAAQSAVVSQTSRQPWTIYVTMDYGGGGANIDRNASGTAFVVSQNDSVFGRGWGLSLVDRLVNIPADAYGPAGQLRLFGTGGWRFYQDVGGGSFQSEGCDPGSLVRHGNGTFTYTHPSGDRWEFDSAGRQTAWVRADNRETVGFVYDGQGRLERLTLPDGAVSTFSYNAAGKVASVLTEGTRRVTFQYSGSNLTKVVDPDQRATTFTGSPLGAVVKQLSAQPLMEWTRDFSYEAGAAVSFTDVDGSRVEVAPAAVQGLTSIVAGPARAEVVSAGNVTHWELDRRGRPLRRIAPDGGVSVWARDSVGRLTAYTDPLQRITTYTRDAQGYVTLEQRPDGSNRSFAYQSAFHVLTTYVNERGHLVTYAHDSEGHRISETNALSGRTTFTWDQGLLVGVTDPLNRRVTFQYDPVTRRPTKEIHALGEVSYSYDSNGNLAVWRDALQRLHTVAYDPMGRLLEERTPLNHLWRRSYNGAGLLFEETDPLGRIVRHDYDELGRRVKSREAFDTALQRTSLREFDDAGQLIQQTDPLVRQTQYLRDGLSRPVAMVDALGQHQRVVYDRAGNILAEIDPLGATTRHQYDALNRRVQTIDANGQISTVQYDPAGNVVVRLDALGRRSEYQFDALNRPTVMTEAVGTPLVRTSTTVYDPVGNVTAQLHALNRRVEHDYDALNRPTVTREAVGTPLVRTTTMLYDPVGNRVGTIDPLQRRTSYIFDGADREVRRIEAVGTPLQRTTTIEYDAVNNRTALVDPLGRRSEFRFDLLNRQTQIIEGVGTAVERTTTLALDLVDNPTAVTDPQHQTERAGYDPLDRKVVGLDGRNAPFPVAYDAAGRVAAVSDASGNHTSYAYNRVGRLLSETTAFGTRLFGYDPVGNRTSATDRNGRLRQFQFDALNRRTAEIWLTGGNPVRTMAYAYNLKDELTSASDPDSAYAQTFDALARVTSVSNSGTPGVPAVVLTPGYDAASQRTSLAATVNGAGDFLSTFQYDALGQRTSTQQSGTGVSPKRVDVSYNAAGQLDGISRFSDLAGTQLVATSTHGYDPSGRLSSLTHSRSGVGLAQYGLAYDAASRITSFTGPDGTSTFSYDPANQLTAAAHSYQGNEAYAYDATGNRTNTGYQTGAHNRLLQDGIYSYQYDAEGNRTRQTTLATGDYVEYEWDHRNRLTRVLFKTSGGTATKEVTYGYDLHDRRLRKTVDPDGPGQQVADVKRFVYDDRHIALVFNGAGSLTNRYLHGAAIDQVFADEQLNPGQPGQPGNVLWPLADHLGTVRDLVNSSGVVQKHRKYDSFGRITNDSNAALDHLFAYTGRESDAETGMYYNRARYYDSFVGRFLSEDLSGFAAGDSNLYRYVGNNPLNMTDPSGLTPYLDGMMCGNAIAWPPVVGFWMFICIVRGNTKTIVPYGGFSPAKALALSNCVNGAKAIAVLACGRGDQKAFNDCCELLASCFETYW